MGAALPVRALTQSLVAALILVVFVGYLVYRQANRDELGTALKSSSSDTASPSGTPADSSGLDRSQTHQRVPTSPSGDPLGAGSRESPTDENLDALPDPLPTGVLVVTLEDADGDRLPDMPILIQSGRRGISEESNEQGEAVFEDLAAETYEIFVGSGDDRLRAERRVEIRDREEKEVLYVYREANQSLSGRVIDSIGRPLEGIRVAIASRRQTEDETRLLSASTESLTRTDQLGVFEFHGLPEGVFEIIIKAVGEFTGKRQIVMAPAEAIDVVLYRSRQLTVQGHVVDTNGDAVSDAWVTVVGRRQREKTDETGAFVLSVEIELDLHKPFALLARKEGYRASEERVPFEDIANNETLELDLELESIADLSRVEGRIVGVEGEPLEGQSVFLRSPEIKLRYHGRSGNDGRFEIQNIPAAADYRLWVYPKSQFRDKIIHPLEVRPGTNVVEVVLERVDVGELHGLLIDAEGRAVPNFTFRVRSVQARGQVLEVTSDGDGGFDLVHVPTGNLIFDTLSKPRLHVRGARLKSAELLEVDIPVGLGDETVEAVVLTQNKRPVRGARVWATWNQRKARLTSELTFEVITDTHGKFTLTKVGHGNYRVRIGASGFETFEGEFELRRDAELKDLSFQLESQD